MKSPGVRRPQLDHADQLVLVVERRDHEGSHAVRQRQLLDARARSGTRADPAMMIGRLFTRRARTRSRANSAISWCAESAKMHALAISAAVVQVEDALALERGQAEAACRGRRNSVRSLSWSALELARST